MLTQIICRRAALAEELAVLKQVDEFASKGLSPPRGKNGFARYKLWKLFIHPKLFPFWWSGNDEEWLDVLTWFNCLFRVSSMSPNARMARISSLENMLSISSNSLVAMASQLSEAEERDRLFTNRGRWNQLRSMADAKNLLQYMFNSLADARCFLLNKYNPNYFILSFFSFRLFLDSDTFSSMIYTNLLD